MAKQIMFDGWVSIIPNKMYDVWIKNKFIPKTTVSAFVAADDESNQHGQVWHRYTNMDPAKIHGRDTHAWVRGKADIHTYVKAGWTRTRTHMAVSQHKYNLMKEMVSMLYDSMFSYAEMWLVDHGFLKLKSGDIHTSLCVLPPGTQNCVSTHIPVACPKNKVSQMKEKFGRMTIYFTGLTAAERKKVKAFEKSFRKKFDCETCFV